MKVYYRVFPILQRNSKNLLLIESQNSKTEIIFIFNFLILSTSLWQVH